MPKHIQRGKKREPDTVASKSVAVVTGTKQEILKKYAENDSIAMLGAVALKKADKKEERAVAELAESLMPEQVAYLNMRADGVSSREICALLCLNRAIVLLWEESDLFKACSNVIKRLEADDAEELLWALAKGSPLSSTERITGLKARKPEYQDSNANTGINQTRVEITIAGKPFDVSQSYKVAGTD